MTQTDPRVISMLFYTLKKNGSMTESDLRDDVIVGLGKSRDFKIFRETEKVYGEQITSEIRRLLDSGDIEFGEESKLRLPV